MTSLDGAPPPDDLTPDQWHLDPLGSGKERKWDGRKWTSEVRPAPKATVAAQPSSPVPPAPASVPAPQAPAPAKDPDANGFRRWVRERPVWAVVIAGGSALVLGMIIGAIGQESEIEAQDKEIASLEAKIDVLDTTVESTESEADAIAQEAAAAKAEAKAQAREVKLEAAKVAKREAKVSSAEETIKQNTFGDGIWQVGVDFDAGTYRASGEDCYWEKLAAAGSDFDDLLENGSGPNQTVTIDSAWFSSQDCGEWTKIG